MEKILLKTSNQFKGNIEILKEKLNEKIEESEGGVLFANSEAAALWIIRGCIDYFDKLDSNFLGKGNSSGIPSMETDYFANNIYRIYNAINYLSRLWHYKNDYQKCDEIDMLLDLRTLIVHSGEQLNSVKSLKLDGYKDSQLGRIIKNEKSNALNDFIFCDETSNMDYAIQIWNDKHDLSIQHHESEVDYHIKNENYCDVEIFLKSSDVRSIILFHIENFIDGKRVNKKSNNIRRLPELKFLFNKDDDINFEKIGRIVSKDLKGGYFIEHDIHYWKGYGLQRLYYYTKDRWDIPENVRTIIINRIKDVIGEYWESYTNSKEDSKEIPSLDIREVFKDFTPEYDMKNYLEEQKLFTRIAPFFNTRDYDDLTDVDYLGRFIAVAREAIGEKLDLEQSVDSLICDYFVKSVKMKMK